MYKLEGYWDIKPKIKKVIFPVRGKMQVDFEDGRCLIFPISAFPSIKKIPVNQRNNWYLTAGGITWDQCPEVIHVEQLLGNYSNYAHEK
ncbi:MAG: DUF2442 domain-containing protein [Tannerella sp.]|jgi:hypothetical protein|nr:DUF2442 domain-containing protein [Tannerella sp.]